MVDVRVVCAAVLRDGLLLVARRSAAMSRPLCWELPGGKVEPGESDGQALRRELIEELGVVVRVGDHLAEATHAYERVSIRLVAYAASLVEGEPKPLEHAELRWVSAGELDGLRWAPADVPLLDSVRGLL